MNFFRAEKRLMKQRAVFYGLFGRVGRFKSLENAEQKLLKILLSIFSNEVGAFECMIAAPKLLARARAFEI